MARRLRSATAVMSTTALATSAASTNRQLVLRPPSTGTDRKNHTRDRGAPRLRRGATSVGGYGGPFRRPHSNRQVRAAQRLVGVEGGHRPLEADLALLDDVGAVGQPAG